MTSDSPDDDRQRGWWEQQSQQQGGGWPSQPGYGYGFVPPPPGAIAPDHPRAVLSLVLGLVGVVGGLFLCGLPLLVSPFAWVIGRRTVKEIDASNGAYAGRGQAQAGYILGVVGTILLILAVVGFVLVTVLLLSAPTVMQPGVEL